MGILGVAAEVVIKKPAEFLVYRPLGGIYDIIGKGKDTLIELLGKGKDQILLMGKDAYSRSKRTVGSTLKEAGGVLKATPGWLKDRVVQLSGALKEGAQYVSKKAVEFGQGGIQYTKDIATSATSLGIDAKNLVVNGAKSAKEGVQGRRLPENKLHINPITATKDMLGDILQQGRKAIDGTINKSQELAQLLLEGGPKLMPVVAK